jgi:glycosyltransferase involved in cell wall biosynthesis
VKKVILVLSNPFKPDPRVYKEAKSLVNNGYDVTVLAWDREGRHPKKEIIDGIKIERIRLKAPYGKITLFVYLFLWGAYEFLFLIKNKWDVVHACDFDTLLPALIVSKLKRKKIIFDIFDFYGKMLPNSLSMFSYIITKLERFFIGYVNAVIIPDKDRKKEIAYLNENIVIIINTPSDIKEKKLKNDNIKFQIFYAGLLARERGLENMIKAIGDLDDVELIIVGFGRDENILIPLFKKSKNVGYIGRLPYEKVLEMTMKSDLLFALYDTKIENNKYASPNKLFEAMMCGKPIIVNEGTTMSKIVKEWKCGLVVPYNDIEKIKETVLKIKNDSNLKTELGKNGRTAYEKEYNWKIMEKRLLKLYTEIGGKNGK